MTGVAAETPKPMPGSNSRWWVFCLLLLLLKLFLLILDPTPKFFLGDSASYIWTAISGWIPADRSFTYGYLVGWLSLPTHSLNSLLIFQALLGTATALGVALICRSFFALSYRSAFFFGVLCALDPLQIIWERYVMTEVPSLFLYVSMLLLSFCYLKERRLWQLALIQVIGVLLISLRISYLLLVETQAVILPLIAYYSEIRSVAGKWRVHLKAPAIHLAVAIGLMLLLHNGYKRLNGRLIHREPGYVYVTGFNLLAMWAPALAPADSPDPRLARLIAEGEQHGIRDPGARGQQLYVPGYLIDRWKHTETDLTLADKVAKQTAMHALKRQPLTIMGLAWNTFAGYWHYDRLRRQAKYELGNIKLPESLRSQLVRFFSYSPPPEKEAARHRSPLQRYFLNAQPYYYLTVLSPFLCLGLMFFRPRPAIALLLFHSALLLGTSVLFTVTATVRYLQPLSLLTLLAAAALWQARVERRVAFSVSDAKGSSTRSH